MRITIFLMTIVMALSFCLGLTMQSRAQDKANFNGVVPFVTSNDRVGFLDQSTGRIYMYDSNIQNCLFVGQIQSLGAPIQTVAANTSSSNL